MLSRLNTVLALVGIIGLLMIGVSARAETIVYEPFQGYSSQYNQLAGLNPDGNATGLDKGVAYAFTPYGSDSLTTTGLTFGNLVTAGGAECVTTSSVNHATTELSAKLSLASGYTGTLFGSYLVNIGSLSTDYTSYAGLSIDDSATSDTNPRFYAEADGATSTNSPAVRYVKGSEAASTTAIPTGSTRLIISKFTGVGQALTSSNQGSAQFWALTLTDFANFVANGRTEAWLDSNVANSAAISLNSGTYNFDSNDYLRMTLYHNTGSQEQATFDEIRFGTTLTDVTPVVPEPGSLVLLATGLLALLGYSAKKRR